MYKGYIKKSKLKNQFPYPFEDIGSHKSRMTKRYNKKKRHEIDIYIIRTYVKSQDELNGRKNKLWKDEYKCSVHVDRSGKIRHWVCECAYHQLGPKQHMCKHGLASILLRSQNQNGLIGEIKRIAKKYNKPL